MLRLLLRNGSIVLDEDDIDFDKLPARLLCVEEIVDFLGDSNEVDLDRVGIREAAVDRLLVLEAARPALSLSNLRFAGMGEFRSEILLRFGNGVPPGDAVFDMLPRDVLVLVFALVLVFGVFVTVGVNFFKCSARCVGVFIWSRVWRFRVMMFFSLNSATSALRVRCTITLSPLSRGIRSNRTCACDSRWRFLFSSAASSFVFGVEVFDFGDGLLFTDP